MCIQIFTFIVLAELLLLVFIVIRFCLAVILLYAAQHFLKSFNPLFFFRWIEHFSSIPSNSFVAWSAKYNIIFLIQILIYWFHHKTICCYLFLWIFIFLLYFICYLVTFHLCFIGYVGFMLFFLCKMLFKHLLKTCWKLFFILLFTKFQSFLKFTIKFLSIQIWLLI